MPHLEITELILDISHCNIVGNDYLKDSRILSTFVSNETFGRLLDVSPKNCIILKTFYSAFSCAEVQFSDQNSKPLAIEDKINITLFVN